MLRGLPAEVGRHCDGWRGRAARGELTAAALEAEAGRLFADLAGLLVAALREELVDLPTAVGEGGGNTPPAE